MLNTASSWRLDLARRLASAYTANPHVQAVILGGSAARGYADRYSDVELGVFWSEPPTHKERIQAAMRAGGTNLTIDAYDSTQDVWIEDYFVHDVNIDLVHRTTRTTDRLLADVIDDQDVALYKQTLIHALRHAIPLTDTTLLATWQARTNTYPDALIHAMVATHLAFKPWWSVEVLAQRESLILVHQAICTVSERLLAALLGINRVYHPGLKWLPQVIQELKIAPYELEQRLRHCFYGDVHQRVHIAGVLIEDTFDLAARYVPTLDLTPRRTYFRQRRTPIDHPPV